MASQLTIRQSDSPYIHAISSWTIGREEQAIAIPDEHWDIVMIRQDGNTNVLLTGQTTHAVPLHYDPGIEVVTIAFKPSVYLDFIPSESMLDNALLLPKTKFDFQLASDFFEIPNFENAEDFVQSLVTKGHLHQDDLVKNLLEYKPLGYSERSLQRRFLRTTGMTQHSFRQILRARRAASLLQNGLPAAETALEVGFSDQSHMIRSLKSILGLSPKEIVKQNPL
jgi:hypothetical protein